MQRYIDSPSALAPSTEQTRTLELDTREQLRAVLSWAEGWNKEVSHPLRTIGDASEKALLSLAESISLGAAWVRYMIARDLLIIDGRHFYADSPLGEIGDALKDAS